MTSTQGILLEDARQTLARLVTSSAGRNALNDLFVKWLVPDSTSNEIVESAISESAAATGAQRTYQQVAILGFAAQVATLSDDQVDALHTGLSVVSGREPVVGGTPMGFAADGIGLLGIALGACGGANDETREQVRGWIERCVNASAKTNVPAWQKCLIQAAYNLCCPDSICDVHAAAEAEDVLVMLRAKGLLAFDADASANNERTFLLQLLNEHDPSQSRTRAAVRLCGLDYIRSKTPTVSLKHITVQDVGDVLRRVSPGLRKWTWEEKPRTKREGAQARKWLVDNEYHVQNLLWFVLAPLLPDLKEEDYTPKVGTLQPRADICVPSLRLIVEVKFWRRGVSSREMIRQLAQDDSLYHVEGSAYDKLIAFIWDDAQRSEQHDILIRGLTALPKVVDAIIIPRPGMMSESGDLDSSQSADDGGSCAKTESS